MREQFITDNKGRKISVVLPLSDYKKMQEELEELEDIRVYDEVKARKEERISFNDYLVQRKRRKHA